MAHLHTVQDSDTHFSIDPITREIKTESKKILLIQGDHNAERFTFRLPKLIEHHDMMNCDLVTIHFINISGTQTEEQSKGVYEVTDVQVCGEDEIEFTWLISENATKYAGPLAFCIRFECTTNGVVDYRWQTGIYKNITISNSYYNGEEVTEPFPDILAQWKAELFEAGGDSVVNVNVAREEALEAIRTEGTTQIEAIQEAGKDIVEAAGIAEQNAKNVLANAIKGHLKGEVVTADDVSSVDHEMKVNVKSKNLLSLLNDSDINSTYRSWLVNPDGKTLTLSITDNDTSVDISGMYLGFCRNGKNGTDGIAWLVDAGEIVRSVRTHNDFKYVSIYGASLDKTVEALTKRFNIQLEEGATATEYTPYIDPATVNVTRCGKNILGFADDFEITQNGLTISYDSTTHIFTVNGTPDSPSFSINFGSHIFDTFAFPIGTDVALSIEHIGGTLSAESMTNVFYLGNSDSAGGGRNNWFSVPFPVSGRKTNISTATKKYLTRTWLYIGGEYEVTFTDYRFKVQLEAGQKATDYEEFKGEKHTPALDGTVSGMMSITPNMTILTDTEGVVIDCEYIVDTKTYIDKKFEELKSLLQ